MLVPDKNHTNINEYIEFSKLGLAIKRFPTQLPVEPCPPLPLCFI